MRVSTALGGALILLLGVAGAMSASALEQAGGTPSETEPPPAEKRVARTDRGWYVGFGLGRTDDKGLDETDTGLKIYGGYRFNRYVALEGTLVELLYEVGSADLSKDGVAVQALGIWPVSKRVELFAKAGFLDWTETIASGDFDCSSFDGGFICFEDTDEIDDGVSAAYGLGLHYHYGKRWTLRVEWERFRDVGEGDVEQLGLSTFYRF